MWINGEKRKEGRESLQTAMLKGGREENNFVGKAVDCSTVLKRILARLDGKAKLLVIDGQQY